MSIRQHRLTFLVRKEEAIPPGYKNRVDELTASYPHAHSGYERGRCNILPVPGTVDTTMANGDALGVKVTGFEPSRLTFVRI